MEFTEVDGLRIAYERAGTGPPLVLLHGFVADGRSTWHPQIDALSDEFTVVAWDAPGAGRSADSPETFGISGYADCLAGFVAALGLDHPHVLGLSFGGILALAFRHRHPTVPRTLALASAYAGWLGSLEPDVAEARRRHSHVLADLTPDEFVDALLPTMFSDSARPETVEAYGAAIRAFHPSGFRAMAEACVVDLRPVLGAVDVPTLLLSGENDVRAGVVVAQDLEAAIPGSTLVVLPGAGHLCNLESPEEFTHAVRGFLRRHPPRIRGRIG